MNRPFSTEDIQMANTYMKKVLSVTNHQRKENQNHNEISPHNGWLTIIKETEIASVGEDRENHFTLLLGMQNGAATMENNVEFPQK